MKLQNIVFYYPSKKTGGAQYLYLRCAEVLAKKYDYNIYYVDYEDGFARKQLDGCNVNFINYKIDSLIEVPENSIVIFQLNRIADYKQIVSCHSETIRPVFWCLHQLNIKSLIKWHNVYVLSPFSRYLLGKDIKKLSEQGIILYLSLWFFFEMLKDLYVKPSIVDCIPLPVAIEKYAKGYEKRNKLTSDINFCWLGRLDSEKARNIVTYMNEMSALKPSFNLRLYIIGVGPAESYLKTISKQYKFQVEFVGEKRDIELDDFIRKNVDIGLASGTSALEFSMRGVPTIVDWVLKKIYNAGERQEYTFAFEVPVPIKGNGFRLDTPGKSSFIKKFDLIVNNYEEIQEKSYKHILNLSPSITTSKLVNALELIANKKNEDYRQCLDECYQLLQKAKRRQEFPSIIKNIIKSLFKQS